MTKRLLKVIFFPIWFPIAIVGGIAVLAILFIFDSIVQCYNYIRYGTEPFTPWS